MSLKTDYKDDVLDTSQNENRKYLLIENGDGTYSLTDVTVYLQTGDSFGAKDVNEINEKINANSLLLENVRFALPTFLPPGYDEPDASMGKNGDVYFQLVNE